MPDLRKWKYDRKLTAMMVEDMLFNPILAGKVILGVDLPPHEELRIGKMWTTYFTNDDSGFSTGKTWTLAYVCAIRHALLRDRISCMLSKTFAQGQLIFQNMERWADESSIFRSCFEKEKGQPRFTHAQTGWIAHWKGMGQTRVLPPAFLSDSERMRSERWNDLYADEWTTYGNFIALNKTIIGRVTRINDYKDCVIRNNHIHLCSTPQFKHHPSYQMIEFIDKEINDGNVDYARFTSNYRHVPKKYEKLIDRRAINHMQKTLTKSMINAEINGFWEADSGTFYSSALVEPRRTVSSTLLNRTIPAEVFVAAFDVARGGGEQLTGGQGDDFALSIFRLTDMDSKAQHVRTIRKNKITDTQMSGIIHEMHQLYHFAMIGFDPQGGGLFVQDKLKMKEQMIHNIPRTCTPIIVRGDTGGIVGDAILVPIRRSTPVIARVHGKMSSDSVLINRIHNEMKSALTCNKIALSSEWEGWADNVLAWDVGQKRDWLNSALLDDQTSSLAEMDVAVNQLIMVDVERDENGNPVLDSFGMYKFESKFKKDAAYSLIYGNFIASLWRYCIEHGFIDDPNRQSSLVYAVSPIVVN